MPKAITFRHGALCVAHQRRRLSRGSLVAVIALVLGCSESGVDKKADASVTADAVAAVTPKAYGTPFTCDITAIDLGFNDGANTGTASYELAVACDGRVSLDVRGLHDVAVGWSDEAVATGETTARNDGRRFRVENGRLDVAGSSDAFTVTWRFSRDAAFAGASKKGSTILWPEFCGNLYPCHPSSDDGVLFSMHVDGVPSGEKAVFAAQFSGNAPAFLPAFAVGDYTYFSLGMTGGGVEVGYWTLPSTAESAKTALTELPKLVEWLESTLGPYPWGAKVAGVAVDWGLQYGGLENHPYYHVSTLAFGDLNVHVHEIVHGWFGTGVRLACWHDLVLSEGTADYYAARAVEAVLGDEAGKKRWDSYEKFYANKVAQGADSIVWPAECGDAKTAQTLLTQLLYKKGALFWRDVEELVGMKLLDAQFAAFFAAHKHKAGTLKTLLGAIEVASGKSLDALIDKWLKTKKP